MRTRGVALLSWLSLQDLPGGSTRASDIWGYVSPSGREYAIIGLERGTAFVDITDPVNPAIAGHVVSPTSIWKEVTTYDQYAYVVTEAGGGMQVIDLHQIDQHQVTLTGTVTTLGLNRTHTIRVNPSTGFLYLNGSNLYGGGLVAFNVADPANPQFAGAWNTAYVHDSYTVRYDQGPYAGKEISFACLGGAGLGVLDVTNKASMTTLSVTTYPNLTYCHYGWLDDARHYFYVNDELDEQVHPGLPTTTYVIDVTDLAHPQYVSSFTNGNSAIDHNPIGGDHFLFEANYRSGLRIYDIADPQNVQEVGCFDTYPADDQPQFNGAWGVHLMPSGVIIVSDIERGLFVFDASLVTAVGPRASSGDAAGALLPATPNPFRDHVRLGFDLLQPGPATLRIVDMSGRVVATLADGPYFPERSSFDWEVGVRTPGLPGGAYEVVLDTPRGRSAQRIVRVR
jgi:choice-of-anchor B domain-containing protein